MKLRSVLLILLVSYCTTNMWGSELTDLAGKVYTGSLESLTSSSVLLQSETGKIEVPVDQIMKITLPNSKVKMPQTSDPFIKVTLTDHSELIGSATKSDGLNVTINTIALGELQVPPRKVKSILFSLLDETTQPQWKKLIQKKVSDDLLVIKKGNTLDFLPGVVTQFDAKNVMFLYEGNEIPVRLGKVFGIIHPHPFAPPQQAKCRLETTSGDSLFVEEITLKEEIFQVRTGPDHFITMPLAEVRLLDFSLGRIVYLSDMPPEGVEYTPYFDTVWEYQRDRTIDGSPLKLGNKEYSKGLWIHSKTRLTYRLAGEFSRFQALMGIDASVAKSGLGNVHVTITADEKIILEEEVTAFTAPQKIDLDISGHRFLHILVDFGEGLNIADRLDLVEARLIK